jgi:hypothetical protein
LPSVEIKIQSFYGRPSKVLFSEKIVDALLDSIEDTTLKNVPLNTVGIDIKLDSDDFTE